MEKPTAQEENDNSQLLKASPQHLFEKLMEQTADRIYIKDRQGRFVAVSKALADMHKIKNRAELEGKTDFDLFSEEHASQAYEDEQNILRTNKPIINKIEKETWPDGSVTWASTSKAPFHLSSGQTAGIFGISRDVTAEVIALDKLAKNEQRMRDQNEIMRSDYESAMKVQSVMIPGRVPHVNNINIAYIWKPMTSVGGDIINFPRNPGNRLLFFLGDVCGHGVTAALYTVLLKYLTAHSAEVYNDNPQEFLSAVNEKVTGRIDRGFITGLAGHFENRKQDGSRRLILSHTGHRQVLIYRCASAEIELVTLPPGIVMGIPGPGAAKSKAFNLQHGDRFYAFTDGIVEASNSEGEEFGMKRITACFLKHSKLPIQNTLKNIYNDVSKYTDSPDQQDDITILGFEVT